MTSSAMIKHGPPSPPLSESRELQQGFNTLMQHNAATQYRSEPYAQDHGTYFQSGSNTTFSSPEPSHLGVDPYGRSQYHTYAHQQDLDLGYGSPVYYSNPGSDYNGHPPPQHSQYPDQGYYTYESPTPMTSDQGNGVTRIAKNGQLVVPNGSIEVARGNSQERSRSSNTPRAKRTSKQKGEKAKIPKIDAPLSELTKNMDNIPVKDMYEWVTRPAELRRAEVAKRSGYVARPMNSFMLYRSAYAERTKIWCLQNNHQVVSSVSGESWPLEPPEVRDKYSEYARVERENHAKAHPGYKFSPSKSQTSGRKRKGASEEVEEEEPSDLDDPDYGWRPKAGKKARAKRTKGSSQDPGYPSSSTSHEDLGRGGYNLNTGQNRSSYQFTNPGKPPPKQIDVDALYNQYYQTNTYPSSMGSNVEDVVIRKTETPSMQYVTAQPLVGLPGAHHYELLDHQIFDHSPAALNDPQVDPLLLAYDNEYPGHQNDLIDAQQIQDGQDQVSLFDTDPQMSSHQDGLPMHPESEQWQFESLPGQSDGLLDDFDEFMGMHNNR